MTNQHQPNLFTYATSELSQDAFICWLAAWADPKWKDVDAGLHETGRAFVATTNCRPCLSAMTTHPNLSKTAFWDVDMQTLDYEQQARFVIEKVMNDGLWADIQEIMRHYGRDRVKTEVVQVAYLKKKTLSFCCAIFDLTPDQFRCYTRQQSNPTPWPY